MNNYKAFVTIRLRDGILDVQGKTVENALHSMAFNSINNIKIGKYVELNVEAESFESAEEIVNQACMQLIANPIIEDYFIDLVESEE